VPDITGLFHEMTPESRSTEIVLSLSPALSSGIEHRSAGLDISCDGPIMVAAMADFRFRVINALCESGVWLFALVTGCYTLLSVGCILTIELRVAITPGNRAELYQTAPPDTPSPSRVEPTGRHEFRRSLSNCILPTAATTIALLVGFTCSVSRRWAWWAWLMGALSGAPVVLRCATINSGHQAPLHLQWWFMLSSLSLFAFIVAWLTRWKRS
jgi:hypothetical protein